MSSNINLSEEFPSVSTQMWKEKIIQDLKGADYDEKMIWKTDEGFDIQPFYRKENLLGYDFSIPEKAKKGWLIAQYINGNNIQKAKTLIEEGVEEFHLKLHGNEDEREFETIFKNLPLHKAVIYTPVPLSTLHKWKKIMEYQSFSPNDVTGGIYSEFDLSSEVAYYLIDETQSFPNYKIIYIENKNNSIIKELSTCLHWAVDYMDYLTDKGFSINNIISRICFKFYISSNYFMEIAKLRAARILWEHILHAYSLNKQLDRPMYILAETNISDKTTDKYTNMLRTQTQAMSAVIGGADALIVQPFDLTNDEFAKRMARNQQLLLREEALIDKTSNPADGSYYIEVLTREIAAKAWSAFLKLQKES